MNIKPIDKTIRDLFISGRQFVIPRFQREYSWEKRNYKEFFDDILNGLEISGNIVSPAPYFVGTMLFVGNFTDNNKTEIQVVDGQQRLTTITILFSAMSEVFKSLDEDALSSAMFKYVMTSDDDGNEVRIIKTKTSYPFFSYYIQDRDKTNINEAPTTEEEENIKNTYDYFRSRLDEKQLKSYFTKKTIDVSGIPYVDILKAIRDQVLGCTFVSISTDDYKQANRIFEILNAKGKQLQYIDLIKNKIFEILDDEEPADYAEEKWKAIKLSLASVESSSVGIATFFRHYWASKYKASSADRLYDDFLKNVPSNQATYKELLMDMHENAKLYAIILRPDRSSYDNRKEYFWLVQSLNVLTNQFNIAQIRVVLLPLMMAKNNDLLSMKVFKDTVFFLESFHFAYTAIMSNTTNKVDSVYSKFAIEFRKCDIKNIGKEVIKTLLVDKLLLLLPSKEQFCEKFQYLSYTKTNTSSNLKCKYAIFKLNCYYSGKELFDDELSIEHILPESSGDISLNIGNLIALEGSINGKAGNKPYTEKRLLYSDSSYPWVKSFIDENAEWQEKDISIRAQKMAETYYDHVLIHSL